MLTLYWFWSYNPQKARLALEELGLEYSLVTVDLTRGGQHTDLIGELNPEPQGADPGGRAVPPVGVERDPHLPRRAHAPAVAGRGGGQGARGAVAVLRVAPPVGADRRAVVQRLRGAADEPPRRTRWHGSAPRRTAPATSRWSTSAWTGRPGCSATSSRSWTAATRPLFDALSLAGEYLAAYPAIDRYLARTRERRSWKACAFRTA